MESPLKKPMETAAPLGKQKNMWERCLWRSCTHVSSGYIWIHLDSYLSHITVNHGGFLCRKGDALGGWAIIPLAVSAGTWPSVLISIHFKFGSSHASDPLI